MQWTILVYVAVQQIERASFTTPWPPHAYKTELETNRLATYVVARMGEGRVAMGLAETAS